MSCATCHDPSKAFSDGRPRAVGAHGQIGTRNAPSLLDVADHKDLMWDGRVGSLEDQARLPITNPMEHGLGDGDALVTILQKDEMYARAFRKAFAPQQEPISFTNFTAALAAFQRTLRSRPSAFDRYIQNPASDALSPAARSGFALYRGKARCDSCHPADAPVAFTDQKYHRSPVALSADVIKDLGPLSKQIRELHSKHDSASLNSLLSLNGRAAALGRYVVTLDPQDIGAFRTPPLRNVALTAPYMHDGSISDLETAIEMELYSRGSSDEPIILTAQERSDLLQFLLALSGSDQ